MGKDIIKEIYIHQHKINFLNKKNSISFQISKENIKDIYKRHLNQAKAREKTMKIKEKENFLQEETFFEYVMGTQQNISSSTITAMSEKTKKMLQSTYEILFSKERAIEQLDEYIELLKNYIKDFEKQDKNYIEYLYKNYSSTISSIPMLSKDIVLLSANSSAISSFEELIEKIKVLEDFSLKIHGKSAKIDDTFINKKGRKVRFYSSILGSLTQLFVLILGGLGETGGEELALETIKKYSEKYANSLNNCNFSVESTGTQKSETGGTAKPDYNITIKRKNGIIDEIILSYKFSAKGVKLQDISSKKKHITFETSSLNNFLLYLAHDKQYIFLNNLYFDIKQPLLTQYIAARYSLQGITGGDSNLVFIRFLDTTITISELFETLIKQDNSYFTLRYQSPIIRAEEKYKELDNFVDQDDEKNNEAWKRSKQTKDLLLQIKTQLWQQFK